MSEVIADWRLPIADFESAALIGESVADLTSTKKGFANQQSAIGNQQYRDGHTTKRHPLRLSYSNQESRLHGRCSCSADFRYRSEHRDFQRRQLSSASSSSFQGSEPAYATVGGQRQ